MPTPVGGLTGVHQAVANTHTLALAGPGPTVSVPNLTNQTQKQAATTLQAAGLVLGTVRNVVDRSCLHIGVVASQSPAAGTQANPGTAVNVNIGVPPSTGCQ